MTRTVAIEKDAQGFDQNKIAAMKGGKAGGDARRNVEKQIGKSVLSSENFLNTEGISSSHKPKELFENDENF